MSKEMDELRASFAKEEERVNKIIRDSKRAQKELVEALRSADAVSKNRELLQEKLKAQYAKRSGDAISGKDQNRATKLIRVIEEKAGPKPDSSEVLDLLKGDALIEKVAGIVEVEQHSKAKHESSHSISKKGHIAL